MKINIIITAAAAILCFAACKQETSPKEKETGLTVHATFPEEVDATGGAALVEITAGGVWSTSVSTQTEGSGKSYKIKFEPDTTVNDAPYKYISVFPAGALAPQADGTVSFSVPARQRYSAGEADRTAHLYYAVSESQQKRPTSLEMAYTGVSGLLKIKFEGLADGESIRNVAVTSASGDIAGTSSLNLSTGIFHRALTSTSTTINASPEAGAEDSAAAFIRTLPITSADVYNVTLVTDRNIFKWNSLRIDAIAPGSPAALNLKTSDAVRQNELRILLIGNSFTQDACHQLPALLCGFAPAIGPNGFKVTICQCYYGGRTVPAYNEGWETSSDYTRHLALPGENEVTNTTGQNLKNVASSGRWDIVTIQEHTGSYLAWKWDDTEKKHFEQLIEKVAATQEVRPQFYYIFSQSYQNFSCIGNSSVPYMTFSDQAGMFKVTAAFARNVMAEIPFAGVIPTGTMLQNLRQTPLANAMCLSRDGYHMDYGIARYGAACCCYMQMIYDRCGRIPLSQNTYRSSLSDNSINAIRTPITDENVPIAQQAAIDAIASPWTVTYRFRDYGSEGAAGQNPSVVDQGNI